MANYIDILSKTTTVKPVLKQVTTKVQGQAVTAKSTPQPYGANVLERYLANKAQIAIPQVSQKSEVSNVVAKHNDLRTRFNNNDVTMMGIIMRNFGAKDNAGNQLLRERDGDIRGNFNNAIERLDELKNLGINTLHVLPIHPPGKLNAFGTAGSVYAPADFLKVDPALDDKNDPRTVEEEFKNFINECHKRDIRVMLDLPSCASFDLYKERKDLMAVEKDGTPKTPGGWNDIRMLNPWKDESKRELNPALLQLHKDYVDMCMDLGIDGIRADVSRAKPTEFWQDVINYSRSIDPEFAWLAESYTYEDASPQINMAYDRPEDALRSGFDAFYGQYHNFGEWTSANDLIDYVRENIEMSKKMDDKKSLIGSFGTHDDISIMNHGGVTYTNLVSGLQATLPMLNPYYFDGYQSGDDYIYDFEGQNDDETDTDSHLCKVHHSKPDIFNFSRPLIGKHPECGDFMKNTLDVRSNKKYHDILTKGSFIPLKVAEDKNNHIIAFARHLNGKTLLVVANRDVNMRQDGIIKIPGLKADQDLKNLFDTYGENSEFQVKAGKIATDLGPGRVHLFEIDTPYIEQSGLEVLKQK